MTAAAPGQSWYALRLKSRFDFVVRDALRAAGFEVFLPTVTTETRWTDRTNLTTRPLFAGYIFVRFDPATAQNAILQTRGVVQILGMLMGEPEKIPDEVIGNLQQMAATSAALSPCPYVVGESVTVARGPFAGVTGVITSTRGAATLTIPIEILGRAVSVAIDATDIGKDHEEIHPRRPDVQTHRREARKARSDARRGARAETRPQPRHDEAQTPPALKS